MKSVSAKNQTIESIINGLRHKSVTELTHREPPTSAAAITEARRHSAHFKDKTQRLRKSTDSAARSDEWFQRTDEKKRIDKAPVWRGAEISKI